MKKILCIYPNNDNSSLNKMKKYLLSRKIKEGFAKPILSIKLLGKKAFWSGCILGIITSITLQLLFTYMRSAIFVILFSLDKPVSNEYFRYFDLFFATIATSIGFCVTTIFWLRGYKLHIKKRYMKTMAITNAALSLSLILFLLSKLSFILFSVVFSHGGAKLWNEMILQDFRLLLVLLPICIFFNQWNMIQLIFRTKHWFPATLILHLTISLLLFYCF